MAGSVSTTQVAKHYHNITRNDFPTGFVFGVGTSAYQVEGAAAEGGRGISVWDEFSMRTPDRILDGSNGNVADDMYHRYKEDIKMMKNMGFDAYRFSISWPRLIPSGKISLGVNREAVDYYNDLIDTVRKHEMEAHVTLFHWDLPALLEKEYRGFLSSHIVNDYCDYVNLCFWEFGDRVKHWATFNEPWTYCYNGYVSRKFPPGIKVLYDTAARTGTSPVAKKARLTTNDDDNDDDEEAPITLHDYRSSNNRNPPPPTTVHVQYNPVSLGRTDLVMESGTKSLHGPRDHKKMKPRDREPFIAAKNMILAHAKAVELYKTKFKTQGGEIGIVLNNTCFEPLPGNKQADKDAAKRVHDFKFGWFLEPVLTGEYPETMRPHICCAEATFTPDEKESLKKHKIDFLGLNYYTAKYVQYDPCPKPGLAAFEKYQKAKILGRDDKPHIGTATHLEWLIIVPWGIKKLLQKINEYKFKIPPIYITENGVAQPKMPPEGKNFTYLLEDTERVDYYRAHLGNLLDVITDCECSKVPNKLKIKGFFAWSWVDNYEWDSGYDARFGIIYVDYMNDLKRYPKLSAIWFSQFLGGKIPELLTEKKAGQDAKGTGLSNDYEG